jgi:hypothetical protein
MAYDKIARQRERRAEQRAAKLALQARLQPSTASSFTRSDVYKPKAPNFDQEITKPKINF